MDSDLADSKALYKTSSEELPLKIRSRVLWGPRGGSSSPLQPTESLDTKWICLQTLSALLPCPSPTVAHSCSTGLLHLKGQIRLHAPDFPFLPGLWGPNVILGFGGGARAARYSWGKRSRRQGSGGPGVASPDCWLGRSQRKQCSHSTGW